MCHTAFISNQIIRLGTRSFKQRLEAASGTMYSVVKLSRLNKSLDDFYDFLYDQVNMVTPKDYQVFGPQLSILLQSLKDLYKTCMSLPKSWGFDLETEKLGRNYSALYEINSDLCHFKGAERKDIELQQLLSQADASLKNLAL